MFENLQGLDGSGFDAGLLNGIEQAMGEVTRQMRELAGELDGVQVVDGVFVEGADVELGAIKHPNANRARPQKGKFVEADRVGKIEKRLGILMKAHNGLTQALNSVLKGNMKTALTQLKSSGLVLMQSTTTGDVRVTASTGMTLTFQDPADVIGLFLVGGNCEWSFNTLMSNGTPLTKGTGANGGKIVVPANGCEFFPHVRTYGSTESITTTAVPGNLTTGGIAGLHAMIVRPAFAQGHA